MNNHYCHFCGGYVGEGTYVCNSCDVERSYDIDIDKEQEREMYRDIAGYVMDRASSVNVRSVDGVMSFYIDVMLPGYHGRYQVKLKEDLSEVTVAGQTFKKEELEGVIW